MTDSLRPYERKQSILFFNHYKPMTRGDGRPENLVRIVCILKYEVTGQNCKTAIKNCSERNLIQVFAAF